MPIPLTVINSSADYFSKKSNKFLSPTTIKLLRPIMKTFFFKTLVFFLCFLLKANIYGQVQQTGRMSVTGIIEKDSIKLVPGNPSLTTPILYSGDGIVLFKSDNHPSSEDAQATTACKPTSGSSVSRCGTFTVPADQPYSLVGTGGWVYYNHPSNNSLCSPISWTWSIRNSEGQLLPGNYFYYIAPGKTYTYCLSATMASGECTTSSLCLTPFASEVVYDLEHYLKENNSSVRKLYTLSHKNTAIPNKNYFAVCADGSLGSEFRITGSPAQNNLNWKLRIKEDPAGANKEKYGSFTFVSGSTTGIKFNYTHPTIPPSASNKPYDEYNIELINVTNTNEVVKAFILRVYRVPVLMIHGKNDSGESYVNMANRLQNEGLYLNEMLLRANYDKTSNESFATNSQVVRQEIDKLLGKMVQQKYAVKKVDIVAHSMGGLLSRIYLQSSQYKLDINKLITHNTPHSGSQAANRMDDPNLASSFLAQIFGNHGGASQDLRVGPGTTLETVNKPPPMGTLNLNKVPTHAIATVHPYDPLNSSSADPGVKYKAIFGPLGLNTTPRLLFNNEFSDLVVALSSQWGGINDLNATSVMTSSQVHSDAQSNGELQNKVIALLRADPKNNVFTQNGFNPPTLSYTPIPPGFKENSLLPNGTITVLSPTVGKSVNLGGQLNFTIQGTNLTEIIVYIIISDGNWKELKSQGNNMSTSTLITNEYKVGTYEYIAIGVCTNGEPVTKEGTFIVTNCIDNFNPLVGEITNPYYQAKNKIVASGQLVFGQPVVMTAGQSIEFKPGFMADTYTALEAKIKACDN